MARSDQSFVLEDDGQVSRLYHTHAISPFPHPTNSTWTFRWLTPKSSLDLFIHLSRPSRQTDPAATFSPTRSSSSSPPPHPEQSSQSYLRFLRRFGTTPHRVKKWTRRRVDDRLFREETWLGTARLLSESCFDSVCDKLLGVCQ